MSIENKNYKDTVFRMLFNNKAHLLELYNAINGTNYTNPEALTITTLNGETFLNMKNDVSFVFNFELNLYEHQSTPCPNIPLRDLYYLSSTLIDIIPREKTYSPSPVKIPAPRFFMFYNGAADMKDREVYRLSDLFEKPVDNTSIELEVTTLNVNKGHNPQLMKACETLKGYSIFVAKVRQYKQEAIDEYNSSHTTPLNLLVDSSSVMKELIANVITKAIDECIQEDILKDFFSEYRKEIIEVGVHEYSYERHMQIVQDESYSNGVTDTTDLFSWLFDQGRGADVQKASKDSTYLTKLFEEFNEWKKDQVHIS